MDGDELERLDSHDDELGDPLPAFDEVRRTTQVDQSHFEFSPVAGIDQSGPVEDGDPVADGEAAAWNDQADVALWDRHCDAGRDERPLPGLNLDILGRAQIDASVTGVCVLWERQVGIEPQHGYLHVSILTSASSAGGVGDVTKRNRREQRLPGNDGRWFLELVGAEQPPPDATTTLAELASPDPGVIPGSEATATIGGHGGIILGHDAGTDTNGRAPATTETTESGPFAISAASITDPDEETDRALGEWEPEELSRSLRSRRTVRWVVIALLVVIGAVAAGAIIWLPRAAENEAETMAADFSAAMTELRNELPDSQAALATVTDPLTPDAEIASVIPATAELDARAHTVSELASAPLTSRMSFLPGDPMAELRPTQERMAFVGAGGEQIAARVGRGYVYRTTVPRLMLTPLLPASIGDSAAINELSVALASSLADSVDLVASLPSDPAFDSTRQQAVIAVDRFEDWIVDYLAALRNGDPVQVQGFIKELDELRSDLETRITDALLVLRTDVDEQIIELAEQTEAAIASLPSR